MKILIGGGGTGGHIYPALALARFAQAEDSAADILFVGTEKGLENRIVPSAGFQLKTIPVRGFQRNFKQIVSVVLDLMRGLREAGRIIDKFKPNVVLGTGGYVAAPLVISGLIKRYPVVLHEQNALPGLVNRRLSPFVKRVCLSFEETKHRLPGRSKITYTGNPRASEVSALTREEGCRYFGLKPEQKNILIYSGSRGALKINEIVTEYIKEGLLPEGVNLIYVTGDIYYENVMKELENTNEKIKIFSYLAEMPEALAAADLAVTRSGATTLAELTALGVPAILVPSPNVVANHQYYNARLLSDAGAAVLIEEKDFNRFSLQQEIDRLLTEPKKMTDMKEKSKSLGVPDAAERLYRCLQEVAS